MTRKILFVLLLAMQSVGLSAKTAVVPLEELKPSDSQLRSTELITHFITNYHYRKLELDDSLSAEIFKRYLESLDPNKSYFLSSDVENFSPYRYRIDDLLRASHIQPAYEIFKVFRARVEERTDYAIQLLERDFDFSIDEDYYFDRSESDWAADHQVLDEIWRKRVKNDVLGLRLAGKDQADIRKLLSERYTRIKTGITQLKSEDVFQFFMNAYAGSVEPHTAYFSPRASENFKIHMSLSLEGIGAVLQTVGEFVEVREVILGGPADVSDKVEAGDRIVGVGQGGDGDIQDVVGWRLDDVVELIRGPKGSTVRLQVAHGKSAVAGKTETIELIRDTIKLEKEAAKKEVIEFESDSGQKHRIGVIDVPAFYMDFDAQARGEQDYRSTTRDVARLLAELEQEAVEGVVIDLRGNGGGALPEATAMTGLFIDRGPVVQVKDIKGRIEVNGDHDSGVVYGGPLAVLVDRYSASASEIFAGAIQDYQRGIIIGEPTYGKGTVQKLIDLSPYASSPDMMMGQLKATVQQFFRINGDSTQHRGVIPDIVFPLAEHSDELGERSLENALPWASVKPLRHTSYSAPVGKYAFVREQHEQRIRSDSGFQLLLEQARALTAERDKSYVSLLEEQRLQEYQENEQRQRRWRNQYRLYQGLEPLTEAELKAESAAGEELAENSVGSEEEQDAEDILLKETVHILHDLISTDSARAAHIAPNHSSHLAADNANQDLPATAN